MSSDNQNNEELRKAITKLFTPIDLRLDVIQALSYVIDGFIGDQTVMWSGMRGVGKTTFLIHAGLMVIGAIVEEGIPVKRRRHIAYITEDSHQVENTLTAYCLFRGVDRNLVKKYFHVMNASRQIAQVWENFDAVTSQYTYEQVHNGKTFTNQPVVILDTTSATLEIESENSNSEVAQMLESIKIGVARGRYALWLIGHVKKLDYGKSEIEELTAKGAAAWESSTHQNVILGIDKEAKDAGGKPMRYVQPTKTRFAPTIPLITYWVEEHQVEVVDDFGDPITMVVRTCHIKKTTAEERINAKKKPDINIKYLWDKAFQKLDKKYRGFWISTSKNLSNERLKPEHQNYVRLVDTVLVSEGLSRLDARDLIKLIHSGAMPAEYGALETHEAVRKNNRQADTSYQVCRLFEDTSEDEPVDE